MGCQSADSFVRLLRKRPTLHAGAGLGLLAGRNSPECQTFLLQSGTPQANESFDIFSHAVMTSLTSLQMSPAFWWNCCGLNSELRSYSSSPNMAAMIESVITL